MTTAPAPRVSVFGTMGVAAAMLAGALALAWWSAHAAARFVPDLNLERPALTTVPPSPGAAGPALSNRVVFVMIDGLRLDASYGRPFLDSLRARGIDARAESSFPSMSHPGYVSLLTGVAPRESGVRNNRYPWAVPLDSLLARVRAAGHKVAYVSRADSGLPRLFPDGIDRGALAPWEGGFAQAVREALAGDAALVLVWVIDVDEAGHEHGAASPEYRLAARRVDAELAELLGGLDLERDTVVVVADHGHVDRGGHGGVEPEVVEVPLVLAGAGVRTGATLVGARLVDVAPTVAALLGVPPPGHALGRTLVEALELPPARARELATADAARWARLEGVLHQERQRAELAGEQVSRRRGGLMAFLLLAAGGLIIVAVRRGLVLVDRRVLLIALPAFPLSFYSMLVVFENWLSPSMMPEEGTVAAKLFSYGAAATAVQLVATWATLIDRGSPRARLQAAAGVTATGLLVALLPLGIVWRLSATALGQGLPEPRVLMLPPVVYAAVACYALAAAVVLAVEYGVFIARATR